MSAYAPESDSEDELPPAWEERATLDGNVYYVNHVTELTQWTHPRTGKKKIVSGALPDGWEKHIDAAGHVLYTNKAHGRSTHSDPRLAFAKELKENTMDLRQRFDGSTTALQVLHGIDLSGKTILVTGATNGIGFETARSLALHGAQIVISGRSTGTCTAAVDRIKAEKSSVSVSTLPMDLSSLHSIRSAAAQFCLLNRKLDILILNAGIFAVGYMKTEDELESVFQVNHLANFYLVLLLEGCLHRGSRVVIVSSESHRQSTINEKNLSIEKLNPRTGSMYWDLMAYNHSKLCNVLQARELSRRLLARGVDVYSLHPGNMISTGIASKSCLYRFLFALVRPFTKSTQQGAATTVYCAVAPELAGCTGHYYNNCWITEPSGNAKNDKLATMLWDLSVDILREKSFLPESTLLNN